MNDYDLNELSNPGMLIIITSTTGSGDPPTNARKMFQYLSEVKPDLSSRQFAVFALGDSYHPNFAQCGKDFDRMFEELGGMRIIQRVDCDGDVELPFKKFQKDMFDYFDLETDQYLMYTAAENSEEEEQETHGSSERSEDEAKKSFLRGLLSKLKNRFMSKIRVQVK
jgi:sulfite reductase alpha subunit-like flavoprotein